MSAEVQRENVRTAVKALAPLARSHELVLSHGNGPQVGLLALQAACYTKVEPYPLDVLDAQTEGMIGYLIEQELSNLLPPDIPCATILTMVEVDPKDPAFSDPPSTWVPGMQRKKRIGSLLKKAGSSARRGMAGAGWSPLPCRYGSSNCVPSDG